MSGLYANQQDSRPVQKLRPYRSLWNVIIMTTFDDNDNTNFSI